MMKSVSIIEEYKVRVNKLVEVYYEKLLKLANSM
jgi:hypothetical protein